MGERLAENTLKDIYGRSGHNGNGAVLSGYELISRDGKAGILLHFDGAEKGFYRKKSDCEGAAKEEELIKIEALKNDSDTDGINDENVSAEYKKNVIAEYEPATGFEIGALAADGRLRWYTAQAEVLGSDIFIYNTEAEEPVRARYGNDNYFRPIFLDKEGRPIVPFWI